MNLKEMYQQARLEKNQLAKSILSCLIADIDLAKSRGETIVETDLIQKYIKNANTNYDLTKDMKYSLESTYLNTLLPRQLDPSEIKQIIIQSDLTDVKNVMSLFKLNFPGQYNPQTLAKIAKEMFASNK